VHVPLARADLRDRWVRLESYYAMLIEVLATLDPASAEAMLAALTRHRDDLAQLSDAFERDPEC
jgi:hypothetical protein